MQEHQDPRSRRRRPSRSWSRQPSGSLSVARSLANIVHVHNSCKQFFNGVAGSWGTPLTEVRRYPHSAAMDPQPQAPSVVAVVVACDPGEWLTDTLTALGEQDYPNLSVLVFDA